MNKSTTSIVTETPFGGGGLMATQNKTSDGPHGVWEQMHFKMLFAMVFMWFLFAAVLKSLTSQRSSSTESCWQEARRAAYSLTPYAFMRI
ncbi:MAG: hypothetical protein P8M73_03330 [Luminiphilus sp.]|nr:hypothetical protein [Luminiphilus sp.]